MTVSDELLMAYADGELEPPQRAEVEAAIAADPELARRVEKHRALRKRFNTAFDGVLMETVPERLVAAVLASPATQGSSEGAAAAPQIADFTRTRAANDDEPATRRRWTWVEWSAMAASLVIGAVAAHVAWRSPEAGPVGTQGGQLVAQADLATALSDQLASEQAPGAPVQIGVSFKSKTGEYCRTFVLDDRAPLGGLACRQGDSWQVQVLASAAPTIAGDGGYRPAGAAMPPAVLNAVNQAIDGEPLDARGEAAARSDGWR